MTDLSALLEAFAAATGRDAALWERRDGAAAATLLATSSPAFAHRTEAAAKAADVQSSVRELGLSVFVTAMDDRVGWLLTMPGDTDEGERLVQHLMPAVRRLITDRQQALRAAEERTAELHTLFAIGEILGGTTAVENVADAVLAALAHTLRTSRAVFLRARPAVGVLEPVAVQGIDGMTYPAVSWDAMEHIAARVLHAGVGRIEVGEAAALGDPVLAPRGEALLAVPIMRPDLNVRITGTFAVPDPAGIADPSHAPLGVLVMARDRLDAAFFPRDQALAEVVARQLGAALENAALGRAAVEREHLARELRLAQELQLKLLPRPAVVAPEARAAARVVPAEHVGGDLYLLARLDADRTAVLIGDVSGHGYPAALIMALTLSAAAIYVQPTLDASAAMLAVQDALADELASTEMSVSLCYVIIDARAGEIQYANAGHPHAFLLSATGELMRLTATAPPLGFGPAGVAARAMRWTPEDRVVLFTDGVVDARDAFGRRLGEPAVLAAVQEVARDASPDAVLEAVFDRVRGHTRGMPLRDDQAVVIVDRVA